MLRVVHHCQTSQPRDFKLDARFFDTNVLVYCTDNQSPAKQTVALGLVEKHSAAGQAVISTQVLIELYNALVNKQKVPAHLAAELVNQYAVRSRVTRNFTLVQNAIARTLEQRLAIWDAMVAEAANCCSADTLLPEEMSNGVRYGATVVVNPFL
jgi:predicted nucleic acid-binding protein